MPTSDSTDISKRVEKYGLGHTPIPVTRRWYYVCDYKECDNRIDSPNKIIFNRSEQPFLKRRIVLPRQTIIDVL